MTGAAAGMPILPSPMRGTLIRSARPARWAALLLAIAPPVLAEPPSLALPVDCVLGETCHIQNYLDRDPGPGFRDVACGPLGYDGHGGTDFALPDLAAMEAGVAVRAAAAGVVMGTRDGMPDVDFRDAGAPDLADRECGNGVSIDHGDGWSTQYCHLAQGSVAVRPGARVEAGEALGRIGLSGQTEFPHLHMTVRRDGERVDPFDAGGGPCGGTPEPLWEEEIGYVAAGVVGVGLLDRVPEWSEIQAGGLGPHPGARDAALVLWGQAFGGREGDRMRLRIEGPGGTPVDAERTVEETLAIYFFAEGRRAPEGGWSAGLYEGTVEIVRDGEVIDGSRATLRID